MKILLINPPWSYGKLDRAGGIFPPLGLAYIAAFLRNKNYEVKILDAYANNMKEREILSIVKKECPDIVGITCSTANFLLASTIAKQIKNIKDSFIVFGGSHVSALPEETLKISPFIDAIVSGEGEITFYELVKSIDEKKSFKNIKGLIYREGKKIIKNKPRSLIDNLDNLPLPARDLLPMEKYHSYSYFSRGKFATMITSRGCPFSCIFCASSVMWRRRYRCHSIERVLIEISEIINKYKIRHILFNDDEFTLDKKRTEKLCDMIIKSNYDIEWGCLSRVSDINKKLLQKMKKAGCIDIYFGIESGNQKILNSINKKITLNQIRKAVKLTKEVGIMARNGFVIGLPNDTKETIEETINFAKELDGDITYFNIAIPFPGTQLYETAIKNGFLKISDWSKFSAIGNCAVMSNENLSNEEITRLVSKAYMKIYLRPNYILRRLFKIKSFSEIFSNINGGIGLIEQVYNWYRFKN
jgi:radical SAM superfamily enzyme YgiQ (UPF0313 family)